MRLAAAVLTAAAVLFIGLPVAAIFLRVRPEELLAGATSPAARSALLLSAQTSLAALAVLVAVGTPVAYVLARRRFPGRRLVATILELPIVLPPAVAGIALLAAFGRRGVVGGPLDDLGVTLPFTTLAVVIAQVFVASPFYVRQAQAAFAALDERLLEVARTCGAGPLRIFLRVAVPIAAPALLTGAALAWARALGEVGATLLFAGNLRDVTQTVPLAVYDLLEGDAEAALGLSAVLVLVALALLTGVKVAEGRAAWRSTPTS